MKTIPMKVETKMMAFNDSTSDDGGQKNVVAFRACSLKNGSVGLSKHSKSNKGKYK